MFGSRDNQQKIARRQLIGSAAALGAAAGLGNIVAPRAASAATSTTMVVASPATPQSLDIEFDVSLGSIDALGALYDYLLAYQKIPDPNAHGVMREDTAVHSNLPDGLALRGRLAQKWQLSPDGRTATFVIRDGVRSNWGNLLSAQDVKWTWDRKFNLHGQGLFQTSVLGLKTPDQVKLEAPNVVSFNLDKPNPILLKQQCNLANPIYDSTKLKQVGGSDDPWGTAFLKNNSAGFGPYELAQIVRGQQAVFRARKDYWDAPPFMQTIIMREVPTSASRLALLQGAAVDIAQFLEPREYLSLGRSKQVTVDAVKASYMIWLELNGKLKPFDNAVVRQAMNYALPRDAIIKTVYYGLADKLTAPMPYIYPMADSRFFDYDYSLAKARAALKNAGLDKGFSTTISYNAGDPVQEPIALLYQTALRDIGVTAQLDKLPAGVFYDVVSKREKPVIFYQDSPWTPDPGYSMSLYFNSKSYIDYSNYVNPEVDELLASGLETLDNVKRKRIYSRTQKIIMGDAPWAFLAYPKYVLAHRADLLGFTYYVSNNLRFQDFRRI